MHKCAYIQARTPNTLRGRFTNIKAFCTASVYACLLIAGTVPAWYFSNMTQLAGLQNCNEGCVPLV